jgi:hypothetical protein
MDTDNTQDIIKTRFRELPPEVQKAITSANLTDKFDVLSKKYTLRIDQSDSLQTETLLVMLGLESPNDFLDNLVKNAEMSREMAGKIAADVNTDIIGGIRETLQNLTSNESNEEDNADLEKAADITVDKNLASEDVVSNPVKAPTEQMVKNDILNSIENPPAFIDRLLTGPSATITETVVKSQPIAPAEAPKPIAPQPTIPTGPRIDPYREPIE